MIPKPETPLCKKNVVTTYTSEKDMSKLNKHFEELHFIDPIDISRPRHKRESCLSSSVGIKSL